MINGVKLYRVAILSLKYVNILVTAQSLLLMIGIWGCRGSKTSQNYVFLILRPKITNFGLTVFWWEYFTTIRRYGPAAKLGLTYRSY